MTARPQPSEPLKDAIAQQLGAPDHQALLGTAPRALKVAFDLLCQMTAEPPGDPYAVPQADKPNLLLLDRASDWMQQDYSERLLAASIALFTHGYLPPREFARIDSKIRSDTETARLHRWHMGAKP